MRVLRGLLIAALLAGPLAGGIGIWYVRTAAPVGAGLMAKQLCTLVFESRLPPERARQLYFKTLLGPVERIFEHRVVAEDRSVRITGGGAHALARHRDGLGCTLIHDGAPPSELQPVTLAGPRPREAIDAAVRGRHFDGDAIEAALDAAFAGPRGRNTLAVAALFDGALVAERYAPGVTPVTPLPGWSMAKSATATLAGIMAHRGLIKVTDRALFPAWQDPDHRADITLDQLLRMTSGIDLEENGSGLDPNSRMLFTTHDAAAYAVGRGLRNAPGSTFAYTSGSTVLAARYLTDRIGGAVPMYALIRELFDTLGMHSAVLEPDGADTFIGSSFMVASARDWAKLGQLYLNNGQWQGTQLLAPDWVSYVSTPTKESGERRYQAGFMGQRPPHVYAPHGAPPPPADTLAGHGLQNQALYILPEANMVIVRLGASGRYWESGEWQLVSDLLAARRSAP
jgi:CubicO group peptidase (beta-lactamase class C family)